jgi:NAD+ diphosphatase
MPMDHNRIVLSDPEPNRRTDEPAWWFAFRNFELLVCIEGKILKVPCVSTPAELGVSPARAHYLGELDRRPCYGVELSTNSPLPAGTALMSLRQLFGHLDEGLFGMAGRALQIVEWDRTHRFCGRCGTPTHARTNERAKECPECGQLHFPRLSPAVIVLIERADRLLLARNHRFPSGMYSVIAGFVEPGETLEECVVREVREEVGIEIKDIRYFASQSWPFPHSLMIGFTALYAGGEIVVDETEIEEAGWFTVDALPQLPGKISIARRLIDWFLKKHGGAAPG